MKQRLKRYALELKTEIKSTLFKMLANIFSGLFLIAVVYYLTPKEESKNFFNEITITFKKYMQSQEEIGKSILSQLKKQESSRDSIKTENNKQ